MAETTRPLADSRVVTLDGSGQGTVTFGPGRPNTRWTITRITVRVSSNVLEPTANIYRGTPNPGSQVTGTYSGSNDTDSEISDNPLFPGEYYTCQWTGGDVGATASISFGGQETTGL